MNKLLIYRKSKLLYIYLFATKTLLNRDGSRASITRFQLASCLKDEQNEYEEQGTQITFSAIIRECHTKRRTALLKAIAILKTIHATDHDFFEGSKAFILKT